MTQAGFVPEFRVPTAPRLRDISRRGRPAEKPRVLKRVSLFTLQLDDEVGPLQCLPTEAKPVGRPVAIWAPILQELIMQAPEGTVETVAQV